MPSGREAPATWHWSRAGDPAPGTTNGVNFGTLFPPIAINNAGKIAIQSFLAGNVDGTNDEGHWSNVSGSLELIARRGSQAAACRRDVNYGMFQFERFRPVLNDAGHVAFLAGVEGTGVNETNNQAIWSGETDNLALVARSGDQAAGTGSGVRFRDLQYPALNSSGRLRSEPISLEVVSDPATITASGQQIVRHTAAYRPRRRSVGSRADDFRTISELNFTSASGNSDGLSSGFNDLGQLVFWARFTDSSEGVFLSSAVAHVPGDFNNDGTVDAADYVVWRKTDGTQAGYDRWRANFGISINVVGATGSARLSSPKSASASAASMSATIPEPASTVLVPAGLVIFMCRRRSLRITKPSR